MRRTIKRIKPGPCPEHLKALLLLAVCGSVALLATTQVAAAKENKVKGPAPLIREGAPAAQEQEGMLARATYYAQRYQGKKTSSGARYDSKKLTAAHPTLPLGTRVRVHNLANRRSVIVTINDRCAKRAFEIIDLSLAAARELGFIRKGKTDVRIVPMNP